MNEKAVLDFDPFEGDFGMPQDIILENKMVTTNKVHPSGCFHCKGDIKKGERNRIIKQIFDREFFSHRFCEKCCHSMELWEDGDYNTYDKRMKLHA